MSTLSLRYINTGDIILCQCVIDITSIFHIFNLCRSQTEPVLTWKSPMIPARKNLSSIISTIHIRPESTSDLNPHQSKGCIVQHPAHPETVQFVCFWSESEVSERRRMVDGGVEKHFYDVTWFYVWLLKLIKTVWQFYSRLQTHSFLLLIINQRLLITAQLTMR